LQRKAGFSQERVKETGREGNFTAAPRTEEMKKGRSHRII
jgi:hypothetical protein